MCIGCFSGGVWEVSTGCEEDKALITQGFQLGNLVDNIGRIQEIKS